MAKPVSSSHSGLMYSLDNARTQRKSKRYIKQLINKSNRRMIKHLIATACLRTVG